MNVHPKIRRLVAVAAVVASPLVAAAAPFEKLGDDRLVGGSLPGLELERGAKPGVGGLPGPIDLDRKPDGPTNDYSGPRTVLVELDAENVQKRVDKMRARKGLAHDDESVRTFKKREYRLLQEKFSAKAKDLGVEVEQTWGNFPVVAVHVESDDLVGALERRSDVVAVHENLEFVPFLAQSLPQVGQPAARAAGATGRDTSVVVLDTGVDFTHRAFGSCTAPGQPARCRVPFAADFASPDGSRDDDGHGTNVAGIVAGMAPRTNIVALDVFEQSPNGPVTNVLALAAAIDFAIDTKFLFNTVAMNLSLGTDGMGARGRCLSPVDALFAEAQAVGIMPIVASGNEGQSNRIAIPACSPWAVAVGAVDERDAVTGFSNSSSGLDLLAPGTDITAASLTKTGTSMAAPHVAGAFALMRSFRTDLDQYQVLQALKDTGVRITDPRQGRVTPRIQIDAALGWSPFFVLPAPFQNYLDLAPIEWEWAECQMQEISDGVECGWRTVVEPITSAALCGTYEVTSAAICGVRTVVDAAICGVTQIILDPWEVLSGMSCSCQNFSCACTIPLECEVARTCDAPATCPFERECDPAVEACDPLSCEVEVCEF